MVMARARGLCERCGYGASDVQLHHRRPRAAGGSRRGDTNTPSNAAWLCGACHRHVEAYRTSAYSDGWLVRQSHSPLATPVLRLGQWVLLDDDGWFYRIPDPVGGQAS